MSNPVVTMTNAIPGPSDPSTERKSYMMKVFDAVYFFLYSEGEDSGSFDPTNMGQEFYLFYQLGDLIGQPDFITDVSWIGVKAAPSGFVTPNNSVMPKIMGPSALMVDNGIDTPNGTYAAYSWDGSGWQLLFNWVLDSFNGDAIAADKWYDYAQVGANFGSQYVSIKGKDDKENSNTIEMHLPPVGSPPSGDWDSDDLVGGGAFVLMLNILGTTPGQAGPEDPSGEPRWSIEITFGDVTMVLADASTMKVNIAGDGSNGNETSVNLAEGAAKEGPPQQVHIVDKQPLLIGVYPCWNGIVVVSGQQETREVTRTASTFCRKLKDASIQSPDYSTWFDPTDPKDVNVSCPGDVRVPFGTQIDVVGKNCRFEIAYLPRWFSKEMAMDGWLLLADDTDEISYDYNIYTIYTKNNTSYDIATPSAVNSGEAGSIDDTSYWYIPWTMTNNVHGRRAGEIFAYILETIEKRKFSIKNGNGNFDLSWSGGTPGDTTGSGGWKNYIKSVSVTVGVDGSSGNIVVDKFGVAGQDAIANQSIGAVVLSASGGVGTVSGTFFYGIGMGVGRGEQAGDSTWTIPLVGLEKKLDDIALINPPFMDGETLAYAADFLCRYAGINYSLAGADSGIKLSASEEINSARFDWKSGTSVRAALEEVLQDVNHWYAVFDGVIHIYELDDYGLPTALGSDHSGGYDQRNMVGMDQSPDFEDLRNYIVGIALQKVPEGTGTNLMEVPTFPMLEAITKTTTPDVPWAKCWVRVFPGALEPTALSDIVDRMSKMSSLYELTGRMTIPGNASIKPYDQWGTFVIYSVTHNIDLEAKTWTTDMELMRKAT